MWYELILLTAGMTRLFCPISQYQREFMLNNKIYYLLFISNLVLAGVLGLWSASLIYLDDTGPGQGTEKSLWKCVQPLTEPGTRSCPGCFPSAVSQPGISCPQLGPRDWEGHPALGHIQWQAEFGNKHKSPSFINAKGRSKTACKFSAVSSCFLIWLAPLSPSNLVLSLCLHWGVQSLVRCLKVPHLSNKCFLTKRKTQTL